MRGARAIRQYPALIKVSEPYLCQTYSPEVIALCYPVYLPMKNLRLESWGNQSEYHDEGVVEHELEPGASDFDFTLPLTSHSHSGSWTWVVINAQVIVHGGACRYQNLFLATRGYVPVTSKQAHHSREMRQTPNPRMERQRFHGVKQKGPWDKSSQRRGAQYGSHSPLGRNSEHILLTTRQRLQNLPSPEPV